MRIQVRSNCAALPDQIGMLITLRDRNSERFSSTQDAGCHFALNVGVQ